MYNRSEIMKNAWRKFRTYKHNNIAKKSFSECLKWAWKVAKQENDNQEFNFGDL